MIERFGAIARHVFYQQFDVCATYKTQEKPKQVAYLSIQTFMFYDGNLFLSEILKQIFKRSRKR